MNEIGYSHILGYGVILWALGYIAGRKRVSPTMEWLIEEFRR